MKIELRNVSKVFQSPSGESIPVLNLKDMRFEAPRAIALVGESGEGKTSFLKIISGLLPPTNGQVLINDIDLYRLSEEKRDAFRAANISIIFQNHNLIPSLTVLQNVLIPLAIVGKKDRGTMERAFDLLKLVGLEKLTGSYPNQLSGGESQRVAMVRAYLHPGSVVLADEPTSSLDPANKKKVIRILLELQKESRKLLIVISHDRDVVHELPELIELRSLQKDGSYV